LSSFEDRQSTPRGDRLRNRRFCRRHALRRRIEELDISLETAGAIAGLQDRYAQKMLGEPPIKRAQLDTYLWLTQGLGLKLVLQIDADAVGKLKDRYTPRRLHRPMRAQAGKAGTGPAFLMRRERRGGEARARLTNISDINRKAALTRWRRYRKDRRLRRLQSDRLSHDLSSFTCCASFRMSMSLSMTPFVPSR